MFSELLTNGIWCFKTWCNIYYRFVCFVFLIISNNMFNNRNCFTLQFTCTRGHFSHFINIVFNKSFENRRNLQNSRTKHYVGLSLFVGGNGVKANYLVSAKAVFTCLMLASRKKFKNGMTKTQNFNCS